MNRFIGHCIIITDCVSNYHEIGAVNRSQPGSESAILLRRGQQKIATV